MLTALSIRDIVLIEKLDVTFEPGLTVLSGETGAGKSILLDSLGLALGARGDSSLVRTGSERGVVTAAFSVPGSHAALALLRDQGFDAEDGEIVVRRIQSAEGPSRAFVNDQPAGVGLLKTLGHLLAEIHGQHDDRALVDPAEHRRLVDAFGGLAGGDVERVGALWRAWSLAKAAHEDHRARLEQAERERAFIEHAVEELRALAPVAGEEEQLASHRQLMMHAEQYAEAVNEALGALRDDGTLEGNLNAALRKLERRRDGAEGRLDEACAALDRMVAEMAEARSSLSAALTTFAFDPRELEETEARLFALRAVARKHDVAVDGLAGLLARFEAELEGLEDGGARLGKLEAAAAKAETAYLEAARALSAKRRETAARLDAAVMAELGPLRLERARFETVVDGDENKAGHHGMDRVEFRVAANPGTPTGALGKVASGGELSRFMLALKVVLAACGSAPTLIFDEIDTGLGGAVADAIGQRLARLADGLQVLAVTHSPQVAARAEGHMLITKMAEVGGDAERVVTRLTALSGDSRREEIARMLSGAAVTDEARAQADRLMAGTG